MGVGVQSSLDPALPLGQDDEAVGALNKACEDWGPSPWSQSPPITEFALSSS